MENKYPTVLSHGRFMKRRQLPITSRVAANTQRKVEKINRTSDANLQSAYQIVAIDQDLTNLDFKKERVTVKKRMNQYRSQIEEYKRLQKNRGSREYQASSESPNMPTVPREKHETIAQIYNVDAIRSVRRKRKPMLDNSIVREYNDLQKLQDRHISEYQKSMQKLEALRNSTGVVTFTVKIPVRSVSAYTTDKNVDDDFPDLVGHMRARIKTTESEVRHIQRKYKELSEKLFKNSAYADILIDKEKEEEPPKLVLSRGSMLLAESSICEPAFNVYCQHSEGESRLTTNDPAGSRLSSRHSDRSDKGRIVRFDTDVVRAHTQPIGRKMSRTGPTGRRMSQTDSSGRKISQTQLPGRRISRTKPPMFNKNSRQASSLPMINAVAAQTYNQFIEVEKNPFDTGQLAPQTRSRKLLDQPKEDSMHIWLGFKNREEMEKALREKKKAQQRHARRKSSVVVMNEIAESHVDESSQHEREIAAESSDSGSSYDEDDDDARFAVFNRNTLLGKKKKAKEHHTT